ncbi:DUF5678 domain-containing protein [Chamaesiphon minutus]|uniref:DUF5678 domain-containing protein n=1 Tax=Chamaesiphon minutus (strain ATCC 27169 / PCC 6605) TaxID=1173020 RepID=K9UNA6_CHAP6|nr:DUF5678 domain-containing protein [Chamaesiphon minutus]AFY95684.1 hypothetical protein Cha6605_4769 [Chamaesiphon minutus PCC 6605]
MNSNRAEPIANDRIEYLLQQEHIYQANKSELLARYQGQYIAFENGVVLDSDLDDRQLMHRIYAKYGHRDIFIEYVCDPEPQLSVSAAGHLFPIH